MTSCPRTSPISTDFNPVTAYWCPTTLTWSYYTNDDSIVICIRNQKNRAVAGALSLCQNGEIGQRQTSRWLKEGIEQWLITTGESVTTASQEEEFVNYVWHSMRQQQRDAAAVKVEEQLNYIKLQLTSHYAEFPLENKTDIELLQMLERMGSCHAVVSSEQRNISSKKRHDKEQRLITNKFCGDIAAYNRWKLSNEKISLERVRDVSPGLLVQFADWFSENPDYLYPGSKCIAYEQAEYKIALPSTSIYTTEQVQHFDVSSEHMLAAIESLMVGMHSAHIEVTLQFARSPQQWSMTDKYPCLSMNGCERLIPGSKQTIIAIHSGKLVLNHSITIHKRLPDEYQQLNGHCEREGLFQSLACRRVLSYDPGLITNVECSGRTETLSEGRFRIHLRATNRAGQTFAFDDHKHLKQNTFVSALKQEAQSKRTPSNKQDDMNKRLSSIRAPVPPSPSSSPCKNMAIELIELGKMFRDGLLTKQEFNKAKSDLLM